MHQNTNDTRQEAKVVFLYDRVNLSPQIPEPPSIQTIIHFHTLTGIDLLIEDHFRQTEGTNNSYL